MDIKNVGTAFNKSNCPFLTDDFNHVLIDHLGDTHSVEKARSEFESIYNYMIEILKHCELEKCPGYQRNNRMRETQNVFLKENEIENEELSIKDKEEYYIEILDTMHVFFIHSFDVGFRIKSNEFNDIIDTNLDLTMNKLLSLLKTKRERLQRIRGKERTNKTKFITDIDSQNVGYDDDIKETKMGDDDEKHEEKNQEEKEKDNKRKEVKNKSYSFGFRYNYWNENKKNFVKSKYKNMKHELVNNNIFSIDIKKYKKTKQKAKQKLNSIYGKSLKSVGYAEKEYNIKATSPIRCEQIMAVLFYTDYDTLSYHFSSTFRALNKAENNINCCKLRNAEYANLSRLLCETVNGFGTKIGDSTYYHGISGLLIFSSFLATFNSPTSTTLQIAIATIFAKKTGAILELRKYSKWLSCFNCSWLSAYSNEDERLFIAPFESGYQLKFYSIYSVATAENYQYYIHALTALNYTVNGDKPKGKDTVNKTDTKIIHKLMIKESSKFPQYIQDIFAAFSKKKKKIGFKMKYINKYYPKMLPLFFDDKFLIKLVEICNAFPVCKSIVIDYNCGDYKNPKFFELTSCYFDGLLVALDLLNKNKNNTVFKTIKLDYVQPQNNHIFDKYKRKLLNQSWYIKEQCDYRFSLKTIVIKKISDDEKIEKMDTEFAKNKNYNKNKKKTSWNKIELKIKDFNGCFNHQRHPENLLEDGENVFYSSKQDETVDDWIVFEIVNNLSVIKKIQIKNFHNKKFLINSGIKRISLWMGNEQSMKNNKWQQFCEDIAGIEKVQKDQYFIIDSKIKPQQIKNEKLNLLKLVIEKNHGHKSYNCFYQFTTFGIAL